MAQMVESLHRVDKVAVCLAYSLLQSAHHIHIPHSFPFPHHIWLHRRRLPRAWQLVTVVSDDVAGELDTIWEGGKCNHSSNYKRNMLRKFIKIGNIYEIQGPLLLSPAPIEQFLSRNCFRGPV